MTYALRKFFDLNALQANSIAQEAMSRIEALYDIEAQAHDMTVDVGRRFSKLSRH